MLEFAALLPELSEVALERISKRIILAAGRINVVTAFLSGATSFMPFGRGRLNALPSLFAMFARTGHVKTATGTRIMEATTIALSQMVMHDIAAHTIMTINAPSVSKMQSAKTRRILFKKYIAKKSMHATMVAPSAMVNLATCTLTKATRATGVSLKDVIAIKHAMVTMGETIEPRHTLVFPAVISVNVTNWVPRAVGSECSTGCSMMSVALPTARVMPAVNGVHLNTTTAAAKLTPPMTRSISSQTEAVSGRAKPPT